MSVSASTLRTHVDYTTWATQRLLDAAAGLSPDELTRDFGTSDKSVLGTLAHTFAADRVWLSRVIGQPRATFIDPEDRDLTLLQSEWPALMERWKLWLRDFTDADAVRPIDYRDFKGNPNQQPAWQIVLHLVNHGTHHRGQVSGFLRSLGKTPPPLDLIAYYRALA